MQQHEEPMTTTANNLSPSASTTSPLECTFHVRPPHSVPPPSPPKPVPTSHQQHRHHHRNQQLRTDSHLNCWMPHPPLTHPSEMTSLWEAAFSWLKDNLRTTVASTTATNAAFCDVAGEVGKRPQREMKQQRQHPKSSRSLSFGIESLLKGQFAKPSSFSISFLFSYRSL